MIFNGTYTITSPSGEHRTFKIATVKKAGLIGMRILSLLTGPDNENSYTGFAFIDENGYKIWNRYKADSLWDKYAKLVWSMATHGEQSSYYVKGARMLLEKRCRRCNRKLTHPESILSGIGPECAGR